MRLRSASETEASGDGETVSAPAPAVSRRRTRRLWLVGVACIAVMGGVGGYAVYTSASAPAAESPAPRPDTVKVENGDLTGNRTIPGVLDFAQTRDQASEFSGTLTGTPPAGSQIDHGGVLFAVDNQGVYLFNGSLPAWRSFENGMADGPDIKQLEENLKAAGHFRHIPDEKFTWGTVEAIYAWQKATGQPQTGTLDHGRVIFAPSSVRVADVLAAVGDRVGPGGAVLKLSALEQEVTADVKLADQKLAVIDTSVEVQLPGGVTAAGKITSVGQPTEREVNGSTTVVIPVTVRLDNAEDAQGIQKANVTVNVPSETRKGVLSVPLEALIALPGGEFGVEVVGADGTTTQVLVTTGLFAGGRVEISGDKIKAGIDVVVPGA